MRPRPQAPHMTVRLISIFALGVSLAACQPPPASSVFRLAELVTVSTQGISTDLMLPPLQGSLDLFGEGWETRSEEEAQAGGLWVEGDRAEFRFYAAIDGPLVLDAEARGFGTADRTQSVRVLLNGHAVERAAMSQGWARYEWELPAEQVDIGWNVVTLSFGQALRPAEINPESSDSRLLAARFRRLRVRSPFGRGLWANRPASATVTPPFVSHGHSVTIGMPTDSHLDLYLAPDEGMTLTGFVDATAADPGGELEVWGTVELQDESGEIHPLVDYEYREEPESAFAVDLGSWSGQTVRLRLTSWGRTNGTVQWHDLTVSTPTDSAVAATTPRSQLVVPPTSGRLGTPDVVVIVLDAARADAFEHGPSETPHTSALASDGTMFGQAMAAAPWTGQSIPALFTGRYPGAIGIETWGSQIPDGVPLLAELAQAAGYHTVLWSQHNLYRGNDSLRRGFDLFREVRSDVIADRSLLPDADVLFTSDQPTFAMVHLLPPHTPYEPPPPYAGSRSAWYTGDFPADARSLNRAATPLGRKPTEDDIRFVRARYDENVRFADHLVGELIRTVRDAGRYDDALIVVTSDHGEAFFEHGRFLHARLLYDEFLRVPFIVKWPSRVSGFRPSIDSVVSLVDLAPTLTDGIGLGQGVGFQGRTLLPTIFDGEAARPLVFAQTRGVARTDAKPRPLRKVIGDRSALIHDATTAETELLDRGSDREQVVAGDGSRPFEADYLLQQLTLQRQRNVVALAEHVQQPEQELDEESLRQLRALGYVR